MAPDFVDMEFIMDDATFFISRPKAADKTSPPMSKVVMNEDFFMRHEMQMKTIALKNLIDKTFAKREKNSNAMINVENSDTASLSSECSQEIFVFEM